MVPWWLPGIRPETIMKHPVLANYTHRTESGNILSFVQIGWWVMVLRCGGNYKNIIFKMSAC